MITPAAIFTACYGGAIRCWKRPEPPLPAVGAKARVNLTLPRPGCAPSHVGHVE